MTLLAHRRMRRAVERYLDGESHSAAEATAVRSHLTRCEGCRSDAATLERVKRSLRRLRARRPTDLAAARVRRWAERLGRGDPPPA